MESNSHLIVKFLRMELKSWNNFVQKVIIYLITSNIILTNMDKFNQNLGNFIFDISQISQIQFPKF